MKCGTRGLKTMFLLQNKEKFKYEQQSFNLKNIKRD